MTKTEEEQLMKEFPLAVGHPSLSGPYLMLNWWCHDEQNHLSVAKTEDQLVEIFERVLGDQRSDDAKPVAVWAIEIVKPPRWLELRAAKLQQKNEIEAFRDWIAHNAILLEEETGKLPEKTSRCAKYVPPDDGGDWLKDEWNTKYHSRCANCTQAIAFKLEDFYPRLKEEYRSQMAPYGRRLKFASRAKVADPKKKLYEARTVHGHHQDGAGLVEVKKNDSGFFQELLFFCHAEKLPMPQRLLDLAAERDAKWEKAKAKRSAELKAERASNTVKALQQAIRIFGK